jgi:hypothetical protein
MQNIKIFILLLQFEALRLKLHLMPVYRFPLKH